MESALEIKNQAMQKPTVIIIDYGIGNLHSVLKACEKVGIQVKISNNKQEILAADALILPGVGAFGDAMINLKSYDLVQPILDFAQTGKYIMGVCLGMQLLMTESEEFSKNKGLDLIQGSCLRFPNSNESHAQIKVPQIMWNKIYHPKGAFEQDSPLKNTLDGEYMYFVHSYYVNPENDQSVLSMTNYQGFEYASSVRKDNVFGFQFHPEKSGEKGLEIYNTFCDLISSK
jgi:glutamine amidotransferase